jgi:hypothetical protein
MRRGGRPEKAREDSKMRHGSLGNGKKVGVLMKLYRQEPAARS